MAKKNIIGLIITFETAKGVAYGLCTHENTYYGGAGLIHLYKIGTQLSELKDAFPQFCCLFPVRQYLRRGYGKEIGRMEIPNQLKNFPIFRSGFPDVGTSKVDFWYLWDGEKHWSIGKELTNEQRKMPFEGVWNDTLVIERLEEGYIAENDPSL
jgi:hypothetical protein